MSIGNLTAIFSETHSPLKKNEEINKKAIKQTNRWSLFDKVSDNVVAFSDNFLNPGQSKTVDADNKIQLFLNFIKWKKK
jgi:hypothetical protein